MRLLSTFTACLAGLLAFSAFDTASAQQLTDLSTLNQIGGLAPAYFVDHRSPDGTGDGPPQGGGGGSGGAKKGIGFTETCPDGSTSPPGDGDGDGDKDDTEIDINGDDVKGKALCFTNGKLCLWCIDDSYYALVWKPASDDSTDAGGGSMVGKCPYGGGRNTGTLCVDKDGNLTGSCWTSNDGGSDDDGDGKNDSHSYDFDPGTGNVTTTHNENGASQGSSTSGAPRTPFTFGSLEPKDPSVDLLGPPSDFLPITMDNSSVAFDFSTVLEIETIVTNHGPTDDVNTWIDVQLIAPWGSSVDGGQTSLQSHNVIVSMAEAALVKSSFLIKGGVSGLQEFNVYASSFPVDPGVQDTDFHNDSDLSPIVVCVSEDAWVEMTTPGLPGTNGYPQIDGSGDLTAGSNWSVTMDHARASAPVVLLFSLQSTPFKFYGSPVHPTPALATLNLTTDSSGAVAIGGVTPALPPGSTLYFQGAVIDRAASAGVSLSPGMLGIVP